MNVNPSDFNELLELTNELMKFGIILQQECFICNQMGFSNASVFIQLPKEENLTYLSYACSKQCLLRITSLNAFL